MNDIGFCVPKSLPGGQRVDAARIAWDINPANRPRFGHAVEIVGADAASPQFIAAISTKYWRSGGVKLGVQFLDTTEADLKRRILRHMNAWSSRANIVFTESRQGDIRIARTPGKGYWSYLGTDILKIPAGKATMNLDSFTIATPESEYRRVVRHETGHTLGFPHEHLRRQFVKKIDRKKAIRYFAETDGWSAEETTAQVLTPLEDVDLIATRPDAQSIMCYQIPGTITIDGKPILGGVDINALDRSFVRKLYPKAAASRSTRAAPAGSKRARAAGKKRSRK